MNKKLLIPILLAVIGIVIVAVSLSHKTSNATLIMSPAAATAKLDNKTTIKPGAFYAKPGKHTITAVFNGFSDATVTFTAGQSGIKKVYVILQPNSQAGYDWLTNHPEDQKTREGYGGQNFSSNSSSLIENNPIIAYLPFIGPGSATFKIDYSFPKQNSNQVTVIVTYYTDDGKTYALNWLKSKNYPTDSPNLIFVNAESAYQTSNYQ